MSDTDKTESSRCPLCGRVQRCHEVPDTSGTSSGEPTRIWYCPAFPNCQEKSTGMADPREWDEP